MIPWTMLVPTDVNIVRTLVMPAATSPPMVPQSAVIPPATRPRPVVNVTTAPAAKPSALPMPRAATVMSIMVRALGGPPVASDPKSARSGAMPSMKPGPRALTNARTTGHAAVAKRAIDCTARPTMPNPAVMLSTLKRRPKSPPTALAAPATAPRSMAAAGDPSCSAFVTAMRVSLKVRMPGRFPRSIPTMRLKIALRAFESAPVRVLAWSRANDPSARPRSSRVCTASRAAWMPTLLLTRR